MLQARKYAIIIFLAAADARRALYLIIIMLHKDSTHSWLTAQLKWGRGVPAGGVACLSIAFNERTHTMFALSHLTLEELSLHTLERGACVRLRMCVCVCVSQPSAFVWLTVCLFHSAPASRCLHVWLSRSECVQATHLHINSVKNYDWAIKQSAAPTWTHLARPTHTSVSVCVCCLCVCVACVCELAVCASWQSFWQAIWAGQDVSAGGRL